MHLTRPATPFRLFLVLGILSGRVAAPLAAQSNPAKPAAAQSNPAKPAAAQSNPAKPAGAQANRRVITTDTEFLKEPGGTGLVRLGRTTPVIAGTTKGTWTEVTVEGWIIGNAMRDDKRDGFDVAVNLAVGSPLRAVMGGGATLGLARAGALFNRVEVKSGWVHVRRTGWVPKSAVGNADKPAPPPPPPPPPPAAAKPDASKPTASKPEAAPTAGTANASGVTVAAGTSLTAQPNGPPIGSLETPVHAEVLEHRAGWSRVRIESWVRDAAIGVASSGGITAADIRAEPDKFVGQTVDWSLQVIAVQKADELRPELPLGQPYVLARGPLPETGFVYLTVSADDAEKFRVLPPLARVQVRATIRAGKTRFLPTPVLTFVRRLD
ncbi:MAG: hypothetical protein V4558_14985 [Gemmatimonadota bacterium]